MHEPERAHLDALLEGSSLATPGAQQLRQRTPHAQAELVRHLADSERAENTDAMAEPQLETAQEIAASAQESAQCPPQAQGRRRENTHIRGAKSGAKLQIAVGQTTASPARVAVQEPATEKPTSGRQPAVSLRGTSVVLIRPAEEADLEGLHRVDRLVFGRLAYPFFALRQLMDLHARHCLVADDGEQLVGYCLGAMAARPRVGWLLGLAVLPGAREAGHGRDLVHEAMRRMAADGAREVRLAVEPENSGAIHLYETLGFRISGFRPDYFGPEGDRLIMTADLGKLDAPPPRGDRLDT